MILPFDVVCVGALNLDTIVLAERPPLDDERLTADRFFTAGGGPAATAAVALSRLGARVAFCGVVGDDAEGRRSRDLLEQEGVDVQRVRVDARARTACAVVIVSRSTGNRSIITTVAPRPQPAEVPVGDAEWVHVDQTGYRATVDAMSARSSQRLSLPRLSVDGGNEIPDLRLAGVTLYAPTVAALRRRFKGIDTRTAINEALREGALLVVATDGSRGSYAATAGGTEQIGAYPVSVASTLGAGDVFHGALLAGLLDGRTPASAAGFAAAAAALACRGVDGRSSIPTREELDRFLAAADPSPTPSATDPMRAPVRHRDSQQIDQAF